MENNFEIEKTGYRSYRVNGYYDIEILGGTASFVDCHGDIHQFDIKTENHATEIHEYFKQWDKKRVAELKNFGKHLKTAIDTHDITVHYDNQFPLKEGRK